MSDILDKDFKVTALRMPKGLKGDMEKVKKWDALLNNSYEITTLKSVFVPKSNEI